MREVVSVLQDVDPRRLTDILQRQAFYGSWQPPLSSKEFSHLTWLPVIGGEALANKSQAHLMRRACDLLEYQHNTVLLAGMILEKTTNQKSRCSHKNFCSVPLITVSSSYYLTTRSILLQYVAFSSHLPMSNLRNWQLTSQMWLDCSLLPMSNLRNWWLTFFVGITPNGLTHF